MVGLVFYMCVGIEPARVSSQKKLPVASFLDESGAVGNRRKAMVDKP